MKKYQQFIQEDNLLKNILKDLSGKKRTVHFIKGTVLFYIVSLFVNLEIPKVEIAFHFDKAKGTSNLISKK